MITLKCTVIGHEPFQCNYLLILPLFFTFPKSSYLFGCGLIHFSLKMSDYGDEHDAPPSPNDPEPIIEPEFLEYPPRKEKRKKKFTGRPGGASTLLDLGLIPYDIAREIDDRAFEHKERFSGSVKIWRSGNRYHREFDQPAVVHASGRKLWYHYGKLHRDPRLGPAEIHPELNYSAYYHRGNLHNPYGPAQIDDTVEAHFIHGKLHNAHGPAIKYKGYLEDWPPKYYLRGKEVPPFTSSSSSSSSSKSFEPPTKKRKKE